MSAISATVVISQAAFRSETAREPLKPGHDSCLMRTTEYPHWRLNGESMGRFRILLIVALCVSVVIGLRFLLDHRAQEPSSGLLVASGLVVLAIWPRRRPIAPFLAAAKKRTYASRKALSTLRRTTNREPDRVPAGAVGEASPAANQTSPCKALPTRTYSSYRR